LEPPDSLAAKDQVGTESAHEHLPTAHGFDELFGNLYHSNAEG